jgi:RES domain-containing protein
MSSSIWTECAGSSEIRPLSAAPWRVVEAQHQVATRKLVDSDEEQALLEEVLERHKPPLPVGARLHYLLFTPFRYPPLRHGSRFAARHERGVWYGAESLRTAFAEVAYYRLLFLDGTRADLGLVETDLTAFQAKVRTRRGVDLTKGPFRRVRSLLASKTSYAATQPLGTAMREAGVEAFRYPSARDAAGGSNLGVFSPDAFATRRPRRFETWRCVATRAAVELAKRDYGRRLAHRFPREDFLVDGRLPRPAI